MTQAGHTRFSIGHAWWYSASCSKCIARIYSCIIAMTPTQPSAGSASVVVKAKLPTFSFECVASSNGISLNLYKATHRTRNAEPF